MRSKTTSIKRPDQQPAADEGRSRVGDLTRPIPAGKRISRRPQVALFTGLFVLFVILILGAAVFILPIGTWRDQDREIEQRNREIAELERANGVLDAKANRLGTDAGALEAAGEELGVLEPGEVSISILALPALPTNLPNGWPYNVADQILKIRRAEPAPAADD